MPATFPKQSITAELAAHVIGHAVRRAEELGITVSIAVVDEAATLKAFHRMDGANIVSTQVAQDKAYTAAVYGWDTDRWEGFLEQSTVLRVGAANFPRLNVYAGGSLIAVDGVVVGAIGVSGAGIEEDAAVAATWRDALAVEAP